nr:MAG TPA: hypothetical protein [Crassvirales sp.]
MPKMSIKLQIEILVNVVISHTIFILKTNLL